MSHNELYTITKDENDPDGQTVNVEPTEYMTSLEPHEAISKLRDHVEILAGELKKCVRQDLKIPENMANVQKLTFKLQVAIAYLTRLFESWKATQQGYAERNSH
ncbi:MAG: hypothetical protein HWN68_04015 [Desulfobacterales bacterium]|nr:hypothetical protein [Desulfobacterales bacterium]